MLLCFLIVYNQLVPLQCLSTAIAAPIRRVIYVQIINLQQEASPSRVSRFACLQRGRPKIRSSLAFERSFSSPFRRTLVKDSSTAETLIFRLHSRRLIRIKLWMSNTFFFPFPKDRCGAGRNGYVQLREDGKFFLCWLSRAWAGKRCALDGDVGGGGLMKSKVKRRGEERRRGWFKDEFLHCVLIELLVAINVYRPACYCFGRWSFQWIFGFRLVLVVRLWE